MPVLSAWPHLFRFSLRRLLGRAATYAVPLLALAVMAGTLRAGAAPSGEPASAVALLCGVLAVFSALLLMNLLGEGLFSLEKRGGIMEAVFAAPVDHRAVLLAKAAALALVAWGGPLLAAALALGSSGPAALRALSWSHAAFLLGVLPALVFSCSAVTGIVLLLSDDVRMKNVVSSAVLFGVMGLSRSVQSAARGSGFQAVLGAYGAAAAAFLALACVLYFFAYTKSAVLRASR